MSRIFRNLLRGFGSVGTVYPVETRLPRVNVGQASADDAIKQDWRRVGDDIYSAMKKFEREEQRHAAR